jgi:3-deoxy-7-phosphoheptulonate synthase
VTGGPPRPVAGFQGESGAFSEEAARAYFGEEMETRGYADFDALVEAVDAGEASYGLLPCENVIYGSIARAYDLLYAHDGVTIVDETRLNVEQCLIGMPGAKAAGIERVLSHPVALEQCRRFLSGRPQMRAEAVDDTAGAVRAVIAAADPRVAAIGPAQAAGRYGGEVLARAIADVAENVTRFFVIARRGTAGAGRGRACVAFALAHETGSLHRALGRIAEAGLNLRSLVARPYPGRPFEYVFYAELDCPPACDLHALVRRVAGESRVLGRY